MVLQWLLLLYLTAIFSLMEPSVASTLKTTLPGCPNLCGQVEIPYPFGFKEGCFKDTAYRVTCDDKKYKKPRALIGTAGGNLQILNISLDAHELQVNGGYALLCYDSNGKIVAENDTSIDLKGSSFKFSATRNKLTAIGCDTVAFISDFGDQNYISGCVSYCMDIENVVDGSCAGIGCCQTSIPKQLQMFNLSVSTLTDDYSNDSCSFAFLVDQDWFTFERSDLFTPIINRTKIPVVLDWAIGNGTCEEAQNGEPASYACGLNSFCANSTHGPGYWCYCQEGHQGNPYLPDGCQDIDECKLPLQYPCTEVAHCHNTKGSYKCPCPSGYEGDGRVLGTGCTRNALGTLIHSLVIRIFVGTTLGILFLLVFSSWLYWALKKRRLIKLREKFFQQNGGLLLQQQITSRKGVSEIAKIFSIEDLNKATNNFDESRVLGQGGYGTVYKGILPHNRIVAIKKSKSVNKSQIIQFINEVDILSQINHRNVVKLLGCCLETEIPLLVYEFVSNGTLFQHIHNDTLSVSFTWENRLRIAVETAGALAYLHYAHSIPILHRDVKSANILLDDNYIAKVSDFGASRLVPLDKTHMTTFVQGTLGYLDPESFITGQLTKKSDVYSFGIVLVELLTGKKPILLEIFDEHRSLAMCFVSSMEENRLFHILDDQIVKEGNKEQLLAVAELARRCLKLKGEERPTMKEVAAELDGLRKFQEHPWLKGNHEMESLKCEPSNYSSSNETDEESLGDNFILSKDILF